MQPTTIRMIWVFLWVNTSQQMNSRSSHLGRCNKQMLFKWENLGWIGFPKIKFAAWGWSHRDWDALAMMPMTPEVLGIRTYLDVQQRFHQDATVSGGEASSMWEMFFESVWTWKLPKSPRVRWGLMKNLGSWYCSFSFVDRSKPRKSPSITMTGKSPSIYQLFWGTIRVYPGPVTPGSSLHLQTLLREELQSHGGPCAAINDEEMLVNGHVNNG